MADEGGDEDWSDEVHRILAAHRVRQVAYVPDAGLARLIELAQADPEMRAVPLTSEQEGVGLLAGAWLGGERGALLMQSSGVGNCLNLLSLSRTCRFPLLLIATMRGEWGEFNPWQVPMGQAAGQALERSGMVVERAESAADVGPMVDAAAGLAFDGGARVAVLVAQRVVGFKSFRE
ncbi:MAG: thiamine pyrophosphate-binding protein [Alphaproteobacteria bacterium]|nr:thiamine pyrophosphate-binding protein [Alphaproteobacteria bacterium]